MHGHAEVLRIRVRQCPVAAAHAAVLRIDAGVIVDEARGHRGQRVTANDPRADDEDDGRSKARQLATAGIGVDRADLDHGGLRLG